MPRGSVGKRKGPNGESWYFRIDVGRDKDGRRLQKTRRGFVSRDEAYAAMQNELVQRRKGTYVEPAKETLAEYLDRWLTLAAPRWRPSTQANYRACVNRLTRVLGSQQLGSLTPLVIQEAYVRLLPNLAPSTMRTTHVVFRQALRQAVAWQLLPKDPSDGVSLPALLPKAISRWSAKDTQQFLRTSTRDPAYALWSVFLDAGLRIGEAQALRWGDVDLDRQVITVSRTMTCTANRRDVIGEYPKTAAGRRSIPIRTSTVALLRAHQAQQRLRRVKLGPAWHNLNLVFDRGDGRPLRRGTVGDRLRSAAKYAGVPPLTPHGLRHTNATLLSAAGVSPKIIAERLGHRTVTITLNRYVHPDEAAHRQAIDLLGKLLDEAV